MIALSWRKTAVTVAALTGVATTLISVPANAAGFDMTYDVSGSTYIQKTGSTLPIGPTTLASHINPDGTFTGTLAPQPMRTTFNALGFVPVTATVSMIPVGPATGRLTTDTVRHVQMLTSTASYYVKLSNVYTAYIFPAFVGNNCMTAQPVTLTASTPANSSFSILTGGTLTGVFSIGNFQNCNLMTGLINLLIPGDGNTVTLNLSNGRATA